MASQRVANCFVAAYYLVSGRKRTLSGQTLSRHCGVPGTPHSSECARLTRGAMLLDL